MSEYLEHITSVEDMKDKINDFALDMYNKGRADERAKIVSMIEEIAHCTLYCMADMCDREDKNCEKCGLEYVISRIKEQEND